MKLLERLVGRTSTSVERFSLEDLASFTFNGLPYSTSYGTSKGEPIGENFVGLVRGAYKANGPVFACILARLLLFAEARFMYRKFQDGRPGDLFSTPALRPLDKPWKNGTTGELLARMEQDASLAGNFYATIRNGEIIRLRPDWVTILRGSRDRVTDPDAMSDLDTELVGYMYQPGGYNISPDKATILLPPEVAHYSPIPDPEARWRGMSWLTPILVEIQADNQTTRHKQKFFENAATPNLAVVLDKMVTPDQFSQFKTKMESEHKGFDKAYKTLFLGGGADVKVVGADLKQLDFKATQGAGETRICAAAGVPPVIVGLSEGLQAATYSNYGQARRKFGDHWARPHWRMAAASLAPLVSVPANAELWYDDRDIPFLREDLSDEADIHSKDAQTIKALVEAGFEPDAVVDAVNAGDFKRLTGKHTGLSSVQLQPPGSLGEAPTFMQED